MTLIYKNYYDYFLSKYCNYGKLCVIPNQQMIKTGIDQPKLYVNVNKKLSNLYSSQKKKQFNQIYKELLNELVKYPDVKKCVEESIGLWLKSQNHCNHFTYHVRNKCHCDHRCENIEHHEHHHNKCKRCSNYKNKCLCGTDQLVCYNEPPNGDKNHTCRCNGKSPKSINLQKDLFDCLPCKLKNNCRIRYLIGELLKHSF